MKKNLSSFFWCPILLIFAIISLSLSANGQLIKNGSFEEAIYVYPYEPYSEEFPPINPKWGGFAYIMYEGGSSLGTLIPSPYAVGMTPAYYIYIDDDFYYAPLAPASTDGGKFAGLGSLSQTVTGLLPEKTYRLTFETANLGGENDCEVCLPNPGTTYADAPGAVVVNIAGETFQTAAQNFNGNGLQTWEAQEFIFTTTATQETESTLSITQISEGSSIMGIDGLSLELMSDTPDVPEEEPTPHCSAWYAEHGMADDGDSYNATLEYAFGANPRSGACRIDGTDYCTGLVFVENGENVDAVWTRPSDRAESTNFSLETSQDLVTWITETAAPVITNNGDGTETLIWANINTIIGADKGFARMSVGADCIFDGNITYTIPQSYLITPITGRNQSYSSPMVSSAIATGVIDSIAGNLLDLSDKSFVSQDLNVYMDTANHKYYIEATGGVNEGLRIDIASVGVGSITLDLASSNNTHASISSDMIRTPIVIRKHITLGEFLNNREGWTSSFSPSSSDIVSFIENSSYSIFYLSALGGGKWLHPTSLEIVEDKIIPPGTGVFLTRQNINSTNVEVQVGEVRYNDFIYTLSSGNNLMANAYLEGMSPSQLCMTAGCGFGAGASLSSASNINAWKGDSIPGESGFISSYLHSLGVWVEAVSFISVQSSPVFEPGRAPFVNVTTGAKVSWKVDLPWDNSDYN